LGAILDEVEAALGRLPKPDGVVAGWRPMHGDFAPWNLRQTGGGALFLIDWEAAGWGPPGADEVFYRATAAALAERTSAVTGNPEAVRFWRERINQRPSNARDERLARALATVLEQRHVRWRA
jgi:thiamine kinase-like enzyme